MDETHPLLPPGFYDPASDDLAPSPTRVPSTLSPERSFVSPGGLTAQSIEALETTKLALKTLEAQYKEALRERDALKHRLTTLEERKRSSVRSCSCCGVHVGPAPTCLEICLSRRALVGSDEQEKGWFAAFLSQFQRDETSKQSGDSTANVCQHGVSGQAKSVGGYSPSMGNSTQNALFPKAEGTAPWRASDKETAVKAATRPAWIALPKGSDFGFFDGGNFRVKLHQSGRTFGPFLEKTLEVDGEGKHSFDAICARMGFTQAYGAVGPGAEAFTMTKVPVILLVFLMRHDYEDCDIAVELRGAFPICMAPEERTAMNVIVGRHSNPGGGYALEKFCLYYPENDSLYEKYKTQWPLLDGFSYQTAIFGGDVDVSREVLSDLAASASGLTIDDVSAYEDAIYWRMGAGDNDDRLARIESSVQSLAVLGTRPSGPLALSYDPELSEQGISCAQEEFEIFKGEPACLWLSRPRRFEDAGGS